MLKIEVKWIRVASGDVALSNVDKRKSRLAFLGFIL